MDLDRYTFWGEKESLPEPAAAPEPTPGFLASAWTIRQKSTGYFMPIRWHARRGYSHDEPTADCFPRLFPSRLSADRALTAWLQGKWEKYYSSDDWGNDTEDYPVPEPVPGRNRDDMEVVEMRLSVAQSA